MAKTKSNPQSENKHPKSQTSTDDDKLNNLKSLNSMLLKETTERRQQVDSLTQINDSLQSELTQCQSHAVSLKSEMNVVAEKAVMLEIEKESVSRFYSVQVSEMVEKIECLEKNIVAVLDEKKQVEKMKESESNEFNVRLNALEGEIRDEKLRLLKVCEERDGIKDQLEERIRIEKDLKLELNAVKEKSRKNERDYEVLLKEKTEIRKKLEKVVGEKDLAEKSLVVSKGLIDKLKIGIDNMDKEKKVVEDQRDLKEKTVIEMQKSADGLNELVYKLQNREEQLLNKVADLEKKCFESSEKDAEMRSEIDRLEKEKQEIEASIQELTQEKSLVMKDLNEALKKLRQQNVTIDQLVKENSEINDAKIQGEAHIVKLNEQLNEFKNSIEETSIIQLTKQKQLESEVNRYKAAFDQATKERNNAQANLDGEKLKVKNLSEKISKLDKEIEELGKKVSKIQKNSEKHVAEKKELEKARAALQNEILGVNKSLAKTQKEHEDTKGKLKVSEANASRLLKILKDTSLICNSREDDNVGIREETKFGEEIKHHVKEVESIKKAFKDKERIVDEMKKQLELLKVNVAKADKGKNFWTMVSSATTLLAAVSLACVARGGF